MESLSIGLSSSPPFRNRPKSHKPTIKSNSLLPNFNSHQTHLPPSLNKTSQLCQTLTRASNQHSNNTTFRTPHYSDLFQENHLLILTNPFFQNILKPHLSFLCMGMGLFFPLSCFAAETSLPTEEISNKINIEAILVSIDDFFNRNPFFVAGVTFIWLVVIPLTQEYFQKYKFISAIDAFQKLRDDPNSQMIDIRDKKSLAYLGSPSLKILDKSVVQVQFREGDEEGFAKRVLEKFPDPANTTLCILDNFDGKSMEVAELLFKGGFKEAYAIRGGIRGKNGWQAIQETLLPPSVHIYPRKKVKKSQQLEKSEEVKLKNEDNNKASSFTNGKMDNGYVNNSVEPKPEAKLGCRSLSPYPNYPDLKPPSSPTPSKPQS